MVTTTDDSAATDDTERARHAIGLIDLTDLADDRSAQGIDELCRRAVAHGTAAVCVWPEHVARCVELLAGTDQGVATVVNFPSGNDDVGAVLETTLTALSDGATEIDVVLPYRAFLAGDTARAAAMITAVGDLLAPPGILKVILETSELRGPDDVRAASELAIEHGADFIKTSTGKAAGGASLEAARVMLDVISTAGRPVGLKPSGGIRTFGDATAYLDLAADAMGPTWATRSTFRFGASGLLDALLAVVDGDAPPASDGVTY